MIIILSAIGLYFLIGVLLGIYVYITEETFPLGPFVIVIIAFGWLPYFLYAINFTRRYNKK